MDGGVNQEWRVKQRIRGLTKVYWLKRGRCMLNAKKTMAQDDVT